MDTFSISFTSVGVKVTDKPSPCQGLCDNNCMVNEKEDLKHMHI